MKGFQVSRFVTRSGKKHAAPENVSPGYCRPPEWTQTQRMMPHDCPDLRRLIYLVVCRWCRLRAVEGNLCFKQIQLLRSFWRFTGRLWRRRSNKPDGPDNVDTAVHNTVRAVTTQRRLINVDALLSARLQYIIRSKLSITDPYTNSISLL